MTMKFLYLSFLAALIGSGGAVPIPITDIKRDAAVDFAKDIYPLLKRSCLACHNTTKSKAGLNLETPQAMLKGGDSGAAAISGKGAESLLVRSAAHLEDAAMPPAANKVNAPDLTPAELGLLKLWIDQGMAGGAVAEDVQEWHDYPRNQAPVAAAAFSAPGRLVAAARGNQVHLTEVSTGLSLGPLIDPELAKLPLYQDKSAADQDAVLSLAFAGDDLLATGGFRTVRLWRRQPLKELVPAVALPSVVVGIASSATHVATGDATGLIRVWARGTEKPTLQEFKDHHAPVKSLCFTPDGKALVSAAADRSVRVWDVASAKVVFQAEAPAEINALGFLKGGSELVGVFADGMLRIYPFAQAPPTELPAPLREWKCPGTPPIMLGVPDPAGTQILWCGAQPVLHLMETNDGKNLADIPLEDAAQFPLTTAERRQQAAQRHFDARKSRLTSATEAVKKEQENLRTTHQNQEKNRAEWQRKLTASKAAAEALRVQPEDKPRQEAAKKANEESTKAERAFTDARTNAELAVRLTSQALQTQTAAEGSASAAETNLAEQVANLEAAKKALGTAIVIKGFTLLAQGKVALVNLEGGRLQWHNPKTGEILDATEGPKEALCAATDHDLLLARPDQRVLTFPQRRAFALERKIGKADDAATLTGRITALSFSSDGRLLASGGGVASRSGEVKIWNTTDGSLVTALVDPHSDTINGLAFSPDDALLATAGSDRWARVFNVNDGQSRAAFEGHSGQVLGITWRSDGLALATGGADKTLRYWDLLDSKQTKSVTNFGKEVSGLAWLGTGDTVASASGDATVRLNEEQLSGNQGFAFTLCADPAGKLIAVGGADGILRIWQTNGKKLVHEFH